MEESLGYLEFGEGVLVRLGDMSKMEELTRKQPAYFHP